jgi:hypothetical protein
MSYEVSCLFSIQRARKEEKEEEGRAGEAEDVDAS